MVRSRSLLFYLGQIAKGNYSFESKNCDGIQDFSSDNTQKPSSLLPFLTTLVLLQLGQVTGSSTIEELRNRASIPIISSLTQV
jgi:hypothetical protein